MQIVERKVELINPPTYESVLNTFNHAARNCYQSLNAKTDNKKAAESLARRLIKIGHGSPIEMNNITAHFIMDRSALSQLSRHRLVSLACESARYNKYSDIKVIIPADLKNGEDIEEWRESVADSELHYLKLLKNKVKPETARSVLPMCLATSVIASANIREWRHIFKLRCDNHAQIDIRLTMLELLKKLHECYPVFFEDLNEIW